MSDVLQSVPFRLAGRRVFVAGHRGMVGSAFVRRLRHEQVEILTADRGALDLRRQADTEAWMTLNRPDVVIIAAARVGGIKANAENPVDFLDDNLAIGLNLIHASHAIGVRKLLFLGSTCVYPRLAPQPIPEDALMKGPLEATNEWYAVAKIAGIKLCQAYRRQYGDDHIAVMPTNLYGPGDNYEPEHSHVVAALIRRFTEATRNGAPDVVVWGSGTPRREFLHVDDLADACVHLMKAYSSEQLVNIGVGSDISIREFAELIADIVGFRGRITFDTSRPDGTPRKLVDVSRLQGLGWRPRIGLREGLARTIADYEASLSGSSELPRGVTEPLAAAG
jgi:GDP-L-fucose synthase